MTPSYLPKIIKYKLNKRIKLHYNNYPLAHLHNGDNYNDLLKSLWNDNVPKLHQLAAN